MTTPTPDRANALREHSARRRLARPLYRARPRTPEEREAARRRRLNRTLAVARVPAMAARAPAQAFLQVGRYWRAERNTLRQGFVAIWISSGGDLITGIAFGLFTHRLEMLPALLILVPAAIGMRGNIFGALGNRLGTAIHSGLFKVTREKSGVLYQNVYASVLLTLTTSAFLAIAARIVSAVTAGRSISVWDFMVVSMLGGVISSAVVLVLTIVLARLAYRRGWDLDSVSAPVVTFMGDTITLPALFAASYLTNIHYATVSVGIVALAAGLWALIQALRTHLPVARRILRESLVVLAIAGIFDIAAGTVIDRRAERFLSLPALLVMLPAFLEDAGALGSVLGGRLGSKLHLGSVEPSIIPDRLSLLEMSLLLPWGLSTFLALGISSHFITLALGKHSPGLFHMVSISLIAGLISTIGATIVAYFGSVATFRFGFDPDNHAVPIVTSSIDVIGSVALVATVVLLGVK